MVEEKQYFTPVLTCSNLVKTFHTCSHLFTPVNTCSVFTPIHTCSHLFTPVNTSLLLFTPVYPSCSPYYSGHLRLSQNVNFCTFEGFYFSVLRPILVKLHILGRLIESFLMVYSIWSCIEIKMSIPLEAHA